MYPSVGIDDISIYFPSLYVDINDFAKARDIEPAKLERGLGLKAIAVPDSSEDVITMAAEVLIDLVSKNDLKPKDIGRIYVGTESMVDGSKPIASYLLGILKDYFDRQSIPTEDLYRCDVVDMTFACIGAVDAMQNSLDWIRLNPDQKAIVVSTDHAKYDLYSPGECTQGAGAIAVLLTEDPRIIEFQSTYGVSTKCEHDFFKPLRRKVRYEDIVRSNGVEASKLGHEVYNIHEETPVYDGHFSNLCYTQRITEAFNDFQSRKSNTQHSFDHWERMVFHLPYAYHARRVFVTLYMDYLKDSGQWDAVRDDLDIQLDIEDPNYQKTLLKTLSKSVSYRQFVNSYIQPGERASSLIGNLYTGSIFLSLISTLDHDPEIDLSNEFLGFFAYGSGSKSKVFEGIVVPGYEQRIRRINVFENLEKRSAINMDYYEYLHKNKLLINLDSKERNVFQVSSGCTETNKYSRQYSISNS